jgi:transcriptional regulator GlxA family with amidase domain
MSFPDFLITKKTDKYKHIFKSMYKYYETHTKQDEIILQSLFLELIYMLTQDARMQTKAGKYKNNRFDIDKALKYIKGNLTEDLSLQKVADHVLLSPIHFHNCFKTAIGKTLHEYVEDQRIKKSINLLISTNMTLAQIAYECGFSSQSYFSYAFKKKKGSTPREYAKKIQLKYENEK